MACHVGIIKKGGSLRHASPITHDGVDEKTASSLRILKAELVRVASSLVT